MEKSVMIWCLQIEGQENILAYMIQTVCEKSLAKPVQ